MESAALRYHPSTSRFGWAVSGHDRKLVVEVGLLVISTRYFNAAQNNCSIRCGLPASLLQRIPVGYFRFLHDIL